VDEAGSKVFSSLIGENPKEYTGANRWFPFSLVAFTPAAFERNQRNRYINGTR
jgi:hypothetical protein